MNSILRNDVMEEFAGGASDDSDDGDFDEVDRYINIKISFSKHDALLEWWFMYRVYQMSFRTTNISHCFWCFALQTVPQI